MRRGIDGCILILLCVCVQLIKCIEIANKILFFVHVSPVDQFSLYVLDNLKHFFMFHEILKYITYVGRRTSYALLFHDFSCKLNQHVW